MADKILPTRDAAIAVRPESLPTPAGKTELRALRSTHGKQFLHQDKAANGDKIITFTNRLGAVCYRDDNGELRSIDTTVRELDGEIGVDWAPYRFRLHSTGVGFHFSSREGGEVSIKLTRIGGEKFDTEASLKPDITDNVITFKDVRPGCDIVFKCLNERVKTLRILHDALAPRTFEWSCESDKPELIDSLLIGKDAVGNKLDLESAVDGSVITETWSGKTSVILDPVTRIRTPSDTVVYPIEIDPTVNVSVAAGANDGYSYGASSWAPNGPKMAFGRGGGGALYHPGIRFTSIAVAQGATITSATLTIKARTSTGVGGAGTIFARAADNPPNFDSSNPPQSVSRTTASTAVAASTAQDVRNYDVTAIVQEIVNRAGWASGNALATAWVGTGTTGNFTYFEAYEYTGTDQASLSITYTAAASGGPKRNTLLGVG